jgi:uncharacterized protein with FMN-binding domain
MRRITFTIVITAAILVLLFSYRTSTNGRLAISSISTKAHLIAPAASGAAATASRPPAPGSAPRPPLPGKSTTSSPKPTTSAPTHPGSAHAVTTPKKTRPAKSSPAPAVTAAPPTTVALAAPVVADGNTEMTQYGPIQVRVTVTGGKITDVQAVQYPDQTSTDQQINSQAIPALRDQVISAQSAHVDGVSGATYTTQGYLTSLQSALDAAKFK